VPLAARVAALCLDALSGDELLQEEKEMKAEVLILMKSWHLRRQGKLRLALDAVAKGIELAEECRDVRLIALGEGSLGRIHRGLAEVAEPDRRDRHLSDAVSFTRRAIDKFEAMELHDEEVGVYYNVLARVYFTRYRLLAERKSLTRASECADHAGEHLPPDRARECFELRILRARIALENGDVVEAHGVLNELIVALKGRAVDGASYAELLGRAHQARARLSQVRGGDVLADVDEAQRIFEQLGLEHSAAECRWFRIKVVPSELSPRDIKILESLCPDPRALLRAVDERRQRIERGIKGRRWRKAEWRDIVEQVRRRG
jgi:hypothetical protein